MTCLSNVLVIRPVPLIEDLAKVDLSKNTSIKFLNNLVAEPLSSLQAFRSLVLIKTSYPGTRRTFSFPLVESVFSLDTFGSSLYSKEIII